MRQSFRKAVLVLLSAAVLLGGSGFSGALAAAIQHDLGMELSLDGSSSDSDGREGSCTHGCAGHLSVHLLAVTSAGGPEPLIAVTVQRGARATVQPLPFPRDSFFRPPRVSLA